jgi:hypothetical protein
MDLTMQVSSLGTTPQHDLTIKFSDTDFGPTASGFGAIFAGHTIDTPGDAITFNTYYDAGNTLGALTTPLTSSGVMLPAIGGTYSNSATAGLADAEKFSLTEVITVSGAAEGSYSLLANLQATNSPIVAAFSINGGPQYDPQTDSFKETFHVVNPVYLFPGYVRIYVGNLTNVPPITVNNSSGNANGAPFVQSYNIVQPGSTVDLTIEYYSPNRIAPNRVVRGELISTNISAGIPVGTPQHVHRTVQLPNKTMLIEFASIANRSYYVQYSSDQHVWKTALPAITGNGNWILWIDNGQPKTESSPATVPARFYRVLLAE